MLYRPKFCANCGEKIDRVDWGILTSRRFCQVCESEYKGQDLIPRFVVGAGILIGIFGIGGFLNSGRYASNSPVREPRRFLETNRPEASVRAASPGNADAANSAAVLRQPETKTEPQTPQMQSNIRPAQSKPEAIEQYYYCGAETKKGTPCSRRVKGNTRCYQHVGMPAMVGSEKLKIN